MTEKQTIQPDSDFDSQTQLALDIANGVRVEPVEPDDVTFWNGVTATAREMNIPVVDASSDETEVRVDHPPLTAEAISRKKLIGRRIVAGAAAAGALVGVSAFATGPLADVVDSHFDHVEEQNRKWAQEAEEAQRQLDNGAVIVNLPREESKNK